MKYDNNPENIIIGECMRYLAKSANCIFVMGIAIMIAMIIDNFTLGKATTAVQYISKSISPYWNSPNEIIKKYAETSHFHAAAMSTAIYIGCVLTFILRFLRLLTMISLVPSTDLRVIWYFSSTGKDKLISITNIIVLFLFAWGLYTFILFPIYFDGNRGLFGTWLGGFQVIIPLYAFQWIFGWGFIVAISAIKQKMRKGEKF